MNLQTVASTRIDPVSGMNPPGSAPSSSAAGSFDSFARIFDRRVHEAQETSSSPSAATPTPADAAHAAPSGASAAAKSPQSSHNDDAVTAPPETAQEEAPSSVPSDEGVPKQAKPAEDSGTAAEVAVPADAAAALAAAALPAATTTPQTSSEGASTPRPPIPSASAQTAALAASTNALANSIASETSASAQTLENAPPTPTTAVEAAVPGSLQAILQTALEKLANAPRQGGQQHTASRNTEERTLLADAAAATTREPSGSKHGLSASAAETSIFPRNAEPTLGKNLSPEVNSHEQDATAARLFVAQANADPVPSSGAMRTDGFVANPSVAPHTSSTTPAALTVHTPPADAERWASETTQRLVWVAGRGETKAELQLTPPSLGKLEVSLQLNNDQLTAHFVASSQAARDALERALPQLREQLAQSGLSLGQTSVSTGGGDSNPQSREDTASVHLVPGTTSRVSTAPDPLSLKSTRAGSSLIDHYA